jgi:hypothetical protein
VEDSAGTIQTSNFFTIEVPGGGPLLITSNILPEGCTGCPYDVDLHGAGGTTPYVHDQVENPDAGAGWVILDTQLAPLSATEQGVDFGTLPPPGLTLDIGGLLSGIPTQRGTYSISMQLTDSSEPPQVATGMVSLIIETMDQAVLGSGLLFLAPTVPQATLGEFYQQHLDTNASNPSLVVYEVVDGDGHDTEAAHATLPAGMTVSRDGWLIGTPTVSGNFWFRVQATDEGALTTTNKFKLEVLEPSASTSGGCGALPEVGCSSMPGRDPGTSTTVVLGLLGIGLRIRRGRVG